MSFAGKLLLLNIQKYEFETLLFSKPGYFEGYFGTESARIEIEKIVTDCGGAEEINNSPITAPSKRICKFFEQYDENYNKTFHGAGIANDIGVDEIMDKCPRFKNWAAKIQNLSPSK